MENEINNSTEALETSPVALGSSIHCISQLPGTQASTSPNSSNIEVTQQPVKDTVVQSEIKLNDVMLPACDDTLGNEESKLSNRFDVQKDEVNRAEKASHIDENITSYLIKSNSDKNTPSTVFVTENKVSQSNQSVPGILHKESLSPSKISSSVHFNEKVLIFERLSDPESKIQIPIESHLKSEMGPNTVSLTNMSQIQDPSKSVNVSSTRSDMEHNWKSSSPNLKIDSKFKLVQKDNSLGRKDSMPKVLSPTDLLRKKQKNMTELVLKSGMSNPESQSSNVQKKSSTELPIHCPSTSKAQTFEFEDTGSSSEDEFPYPFESNIKMPSNEDLDTIPQNMLHKKRSAKSKRKARNGMSLSDDCLEPKNCLKEDQTNLHHNVKPVQLLHEKDLNEGKISGNTKHADKSGTQLEHVKSLTYTSPSKPFEKIRNRQINEENGPGLGAFSFTSPSKILQGVNIEIDANLYSTSSNLLRKMDHRALSESKASSLALGACSSASPAELLMKAEFEKELDKNEESMPSRFVSSESGQEISGSADEVQTESELCAAKKLSKKWLEGCERKDRFNTFAKSSDEKFTSGVQNTSSHFIDDADDLGKSDNLLTKEDHMKREVTKQGHVSNKNTVSQEEVDIIVKNSKLNSDAEVTADVKHKAEDYLNSLVRSFLVHMKNKQAKNEKITDEDLKELKLIQALASERFNHLQQCIENDIDNEFYALQDESDESRYSVNNYVESLSKSLCELNNLFIENAVDFEKSGNLSIKEDDMKREVTGQDHFSYKYTDAQEPTKSLIEDQQNHHHNIKPVKKLHEHALNDEKISGNAQDAAKSVTQLDHIKSLTYRSPSKLFEENRNRQINEENGPGLGAFSCTSPSKRLQGLDSAIDTNLFSRSSNLLRKIDNKALSDSQTSSLVLGACSFASPEELLMKAEFEKTLDEDEESMPSKLVNSESGQAFPGSSHEVEGVLDAMAKISDEKFTSRVKNTSKDYIENADDLEKSGNLSTEGDHINSVVSKHGHVSDKTAYAQKSTNYIIDNQTSPYNNIKQVKTLDEKYLSEGNILADTKHIANSATQLEHVQSFTYTSPSRLFEKIKNRQINEENGPGLGTFSFTSPSNLLQGVDSGIDTNLHSTSSNLRKIDHKALSDSQTSSLVLGACSFSSPEELLMKAEFEKELNGDEESMTSKLVSTDSGHTFPDSSHEVETESELQAAKKLSKKWLERCKRKGRLDALAKRSYEKFTSRVQNTSSHFIEDPDDLEKDSNVLFKEDPIYREVTKEGHVSDKNTVGQEEINMKVKKSILNSDADVSSDVKHRAEDYLNSLVRSFLVHINNKQAKNEKITDEDLKELELIQALVSETFNHLQLCIKNDVDNEYYELQDENDESRYSVNNSLESLSKSLCKLNDLYLALEQKMIHGSNHTFASKASIVNACMTESDWEIFSDDECKQDCTNVVRASDTAKTDDGYLGDTSSSDIACVDNENKLNVESVGKSGKGLVSWGEVDLPGGEKDQSDSQDTERGKDQEGSPEQGQRSTAGGQNLGQRDGAGKRKQAVGRSLTPDSRLMLDKEVTESQNRKLQTEVSTLQTENKLLKEKYNRAQARITDLETQLSEAQDDLTTLQENLDHEMSDLTSRTKQEVNRDRAQLHSRIMSLTKDNEALKLEVSSLEKRLEGAHKVTDLARHSSESTLTQEAHRSEVNTLKEEVGRLKDLLDQSERHVREEEERHTSTRREVQKLTELKNALQQHPEVTSCGVVTEKQVQSLEKRLKVTEERLHQERADRANNLSNVEDKLLTDNAKLQASEKELLRQLHREKEKNRNFEQRVKQLREENEKLRLALPFDDTSLLPRKGIYDIPYSSHSSDRAETMKPNISDDMNYIMSQIEKQDGLEMEADKEEVIRVLWNKRELAYKQLRDFDVQLQGLQLSDNNFVDGLKNLRDTYGQADNKLRAMEEEVEDTNSRLATLEQTYKQQVTVLVHERHDAFSRLKTAEDLLAAVRAENETLHQNVALSYLPAGIILKGPSDAGGVEGLHAHVSSLEGKVAQLTRTNQLLEGELTTLRVQLDARDKQLQDVQRDLDLAYKRLGGDDSEDRKQQKIDKLTAQMKESQVELEILEEKHNSTMTENSRLESELKTLRKQSSSQKSRQQKTEQIETKVLQKLKDDLSERESEVTSLSKQLEDQEEQLQKTREELYMERMHSSELEAEVENLQEMVAQRAQMFEALSGSEREQLAQYQILKETLDNASQELAQKHTQIISLDVNLSSQKDRCAELEEEVARLRRHLNTDKGGEECTEEQSTTQQLKIKELQKERAQLKQELQQAYSAIQAAEEQYRTLQTETTQLEQELVKEKTVILQITAEKGEIEQHIEELADEHESLVQEKNQAEEDIVKLETKLQEILARYEQEASRQHGHFQEQYPGLPQEANKVVMELDSLRVVVEGKNKEISMLQDRLNRQNLELDFLQRKVELVHNDSIANREDVARMISELTLKMKEAVSTREVNQYLVAERTKLQNERSHLEQELALERQGSEERRLEMQEVITKIENAETSLMSTEKDSRNKENVLLTLEADLRNANRNLAHLESENADLKERVDNLTEELRQVTTVNATLESRLDSEQNSLSVQKNLVSKWKEDFTRLSNDRDMIRHEHSVLSDKYTTELKNVATLKHELATLTSEYERLSKELTSTQRELDTLKGHLLLTKDTVHKLTQDKGSIAQDFDGMCRTLTEKERQLQELRERTEERVEALKREHAQERLRLQQDHDRAVTERETVKNENDRLNEELKQKEIQLNTFGRTLQDLESVTREKKQLEAQVGKLESSTGDSRVLLEGQRKELIALNEALAKQQERSTLIEAENHLLKSDLKTTQESSSRESQELKIAIKELKSQHENERHYLNDNLTQTQSRLRSVEASLVSAASERDSLQAKCRLQEKSLEEIQARLAEEHTGRRLVEQSVGSLRLQLEEARNNKNVAEARCVEVKNQLTQAEDRIRHKDEKCTDLSAQLQELQALSHGNRSSVKAKNEQIDILQKEVSRLKQLIESQKQTLNASMKKTSLEAKQQLEIVSQEKDRFAVQLQQTATDLDSCREHIASKNKENLKLQEEILVLEDSVRECRVRQKQAEDTLKVEMDKQADLTARFEAQDEELKRLRTFLARKVEDSSDTDKTMWQEMNRVIQELSRQMTSHLDAQRSIGKDGKGADNAVTRFRKQLSEVQADLNTERSLHQITRTSLQALEEDCARLRKQLQILRRREPPTTEKKHKNRMEAINAIIARSQSQAQAMLSAGGYYDNSVLTPRAQGGPRVGLTTRQDFDSPDNSYSEDLSIASLPAMHYSHTAKK
ncbi:uncharacterized protein LOC127841237 isoform X2 [Dreissena polymorpha]|uniref:uncharacterized protein LOC127841237 isoform X2 n=1 Tax=Dreissena polymorpha TaxID=45954 RepID=UPI0022644F1C|nr:uncharacterized protein LOC127841237 isoform X2 [Dreissena polymorpha]